MNKKTYEFLQRVVRYFRKTAINKILAMIFLAIGLVVMKLSNDITVLVFMMILFIIPLFFTRRSWFE